MANPEHVEIVKLVADYAIASMDLGINKFREFVIDFKETFGETNTRELATAVEEAWGLLPEFGYEVDSAGKVADVLGSETGVSDEASSVRSEEPSDESVGGSTICR